MAFRSNDPKDQNVSLYFIDAKILGILSVFIVFAILLIVVTILAANTMGAIRSYTSLQAHWNEVRKESVGNLEKYVTTASEEYFIKYNQDLGILQDIEKIRIEFNSQQINTAKISPLFDHFRFRKEAVQEMIITYQRFGFLPEIKEALQIWKQCDDEIEKLDAISSNIKKQISLDSHQKQWLNKIQSIDSRLTELQYDLSSSLDNITTRLKNIIFWSSVGIGLIFALVSGGMAWRFMKGLHKWQHALKVNTQKYRSLFEQNPNIVFSFDCEGKFTEGNKKLENLLQVPLGELKELTFDQFVEPEDRNKVHRLFNKAANGEPQQYKAAGVNAQGEKVPLEITNLPIYIDGKIIGVYGIAQNIEERIKAKQKLQEQLEERTVLLEEIHHRVKNNLAVISGLLQLEAMNWEGDSTVSQVLMENNMRIHSMAKVHEKLYESEYFSNIEMDNYIYELLDSIFITMEGNKKNVALNLECDEVALSINQALPCGLIINELVTNAFKYAFKNNQQGKLNVIFKKDDSTILLRVSDNGPGLPDDFEVMASNSLGHSLIRQLVKQLDGHINVKSSNKTGTSYEITFENNGLGIEA